MFQFFFQPNENRLEAKYKLFKFSEIRVKRRLNQKYTYRVLQTIQMKLILLCVLAEPAVLGSTKTALKFRDEI